MRREKGTRAPQPTVPLVLIFVQVFEHRFGKNAIAACSIIYENVRHRTDQLTVLQNGATAHECVNIGTTLFLRFFSNSTHFRHCLSEIDQICQLIIKIPLNADRAIYSYHNPFDKFLCQLRC